jgi:aspartyl-tRNA(Asn)/glutamyl-tRNA(Gln) amidotransferase subunit B
VAALIALIDEGKLNFAIASQQLFPEAIRQPQKKMAALAAELNLMQESNADAIRSIVQEVVNEFPAKVAEYKKGKKVIVTMFMGEVMKRSKGKADPKLATDLILQELAK